MDFFCFSAWGFLFHVTSFGLRPSGLGFDGFFCVCFDLRVLFPCYCYQFMPSGKGFAGFYLFFDWTLPFPCYCVWFKAFGVRLWWICLLFDLRLLFLCYCLWFKVIPVKLSYYHIFFGTWHNQRSWYEHLKNAIKSWGHRACQRVSRLLNWCIFTGCALKIRIPFLQN